MAGAIWLLLAPLVLALVACVDGTLTYVGPASISATDPNPNHTAAECSLDGGSGCVLLNVTFGIGATGSQSVDFPYAYDIKLPSGVHLYDGHLAAGSTGPISLLLPWGSYNLTFKVWGDGAPLVATIMTTVIGSQGLPMYTGPATIEVQDTNVTHTAAGCTAVAANPNGCVPVTETLTISDNTGSYPFTLKLPSGVVLASGTISGGSTGPLSIAVPWGKYPVTFTFGAAIVPISFTIVGFFFYSATVPQSDALQTDAKLGVPGRFPRNAGYALQANNSVYTPGTAVAWYSGSSTHYHNSTFWQLVMDPMHTGLMGFVSFARCILPYYANGTADYEGTLLNIWPLRTTNNHFAASVGNDYGYASLTRQNCTLVPGPDPVYPQLTAARTYVCNYTKPSRYFTYTADQHPLVSQIPPGSVYDDSTTKLSLVFSSVYNPFFPTYAASLP